MNSHTPIPDTEIFENLNNNTISDANSTKKERALVDNRLSGSADVTVLFKDLISELNNRIEKADFIIGCVAWLTEESVLESLTRPHFGSSLLVQKEDFLRPDLNGYSSEWRNSLQTQYSSLFCGLNRFNIGGIVRQLSTHGDPTLDPIRCVGNHNSDKQPAFPRMHNKFLVFCKIDKEKVNIYSSDPYPIIPYSVWTGSLNFTHNASHSLENAVVIDSESHATAYFKEWQQILALSEPLNWHSNWVEPEWRIGS